MEQILQTVTINNIPMLFATLGVMLIYKLINLIVDKHRSRKEEHKHDKLIDLRKSIGEQIEKILDNALMQTQSSRAFVFEYHNGQTSIAGLPFLKMTNTYEVCATGITPQICNLQGLSCNLYINFVKRVESKSSELFDLAKDSTDPITHGTLEAQNVTKTLIARVTDGRHRIIGFVGFDYCVGHDNYRKEHESQVIDLATRIGTLLTIGGTT